MTVIPFEPKHLDQLKVRMDGQTSCPKTVMTTAFTFMEGDQIVAVCGGFPFVPGVIHWWGLLSDLVQVYPFSFHKKCLEVLDWYAKNEKPRRMQFEVRVDYLMGQRWAKALGFKREGRLRAWGEDGSDYFLYGRVC